MNIYNEWVKCKESLILYCLLEKYTCYNTNGSNYIPTTTNDLFKKFVNHMQDCFNLLNYNWYGLSYTEIKENEELETFIDEFCEPISILPSIKGDSRIEIITIILSYCDNVYLLKTQDILQSAFSNDISNIIINKIK